MEIKDTLQASASTDFQENVYVYMVYFEKNKVETWESKMIHVS